MPDIRTYSLIEYSVPDPDHCAPVVLMRPVGITVGSQYGEEGAAKPKTLVRWMFARGNPLLTEVPRIAVRVFTRQKENEDMAVLTFSDPLSVEFVFENTTFDAGDRTMPYWLVETLEFAARVLRAQADLNREFLFTESIE